MTRGKGEVSLTRGVIGGSTSATSGARWTKRQWVKSWRKPCRALGVMVMVWLLTLAPVPWPVTPVMGATINVTTTTDEVITNNQCSLREAIINANTDSQTGSMDCAGGSGADTIVLQSGQTYTLSLDAAGGHATDPGASDDDLDIMSEITIQVQGSGSATIRRDPDLRCDPNGTAEKGEFRIFEVTDEGNLTLKNVTVRNGCADGPDAHRDGGGIWNGGTLTITSSTISDNHAFDDGGGIHNDTGGTLTITSSTISDNGAEDDGGGISNLFESIVVITNSTISDNDAQDGGGIANRGTMTITNTTVSQNHADEDGDGGGINNRGRMTITNTTVFQNHADEDGGGIRNNDTMTIATSTISGNDADDTGGGIASFGTLTIMTTTISANSATSGGGIASGGTMTTITASTIWGNSASFGGGIQNSGGTLIIANSTLSGNSATSTGGGIENVFGTAKLSFVTIASNSANSAIGGGGIRVAGGAVNIKNSIVGNSTNGADCSSDGAAFTASGVNLKTDQSCLGFTHVDPTDLKLGSLANNGGPTETHALQAGSVAIDAVTDCTDLSDPAVNVTQDQRGVSRPQDGDGNGTATCDVGAYEAAAVQSFTLTVTGAGTGTGTVTSNPTEINCTITSGSASGDCSENYTEGTTVTLTATPNPGSTFAGWSGGCSGTNSTTNVTMNANKTCTATFQQVGTIVIQKMTIGGEGMFSFSATGMGLSNFSLTTSGGMASQTFSNIPAGTKTVTEAGPPAGWALASLVCTGDQDNGTMVDVAMRKATIDLDAGETVTCTFTNTRVGVSLWTLQDGDKCLTLDLGNKRYVFRTGNGRFGGAIEFTQTARAIRFRSVAGARPSLSGTINLTERAGTAVLALGLTRWITLVDRNLDDNGLCPP